MKLVLIIFSISLLLFVSCNNSDLLKENIVVTDNIAEGSISYSQEIQPLFDKDCVSCHEYLESNVSYKMITTHNSTSVGASQYVNIEKPLESYLYLKLIDEAPCGSSMGGEWTTEEIALVLHWIEEGALNN